MSAPEAPTTTPPPRARGVLLLVVVFLAGALGGAALDRAWVATHLVRAFREGGLSMAEPRRASRSPGTEEARLSAIPDQFLRLHLTAQQESVLADIARRRRPRADSVMRALRPTVSHMETEMMQEMLCALTPAQQADWLAYMEAHRQNWPPEVVAERYKLVRTQTCPKTP
jgi:hypothetical protein